MLNIARLARSRVARSVHLIRGNVAGVKNLKFQRFISKTNEGIDNDLPEIIVEEEDVPWYLRDDASSPLIEKKELKLPALPTNSPQSLEKFIHLLGYDYGMDDILLFDLNELEDDHSFSTKNQSSNYILIGTGKSEKHCYKAGLELRLYIKHEYETIPRIEGMVSAGISPAVRRRMLKNARRGPSATENTYGKEPNSWIMCESGVNGVQIHFLTRERRQELNLEELWCKPEDLNKYQQNNVEELDSDDIFIGIRRQFHTMTPFRMYNKQTTKSYSTESTDNLQYIYNSFLQEDLGMTESKLNTYITSFDSEFTNSLANYQLKFQFHKLIHIMNSNLIKFNELVDILLQKNSSLMISIDPTVDLQHEKEQDVIEYIKLLLDSPEINQNLSLDPQERANYLYQELARFISKILRFSNINLLGNDEFIALLWRLTLIENSGFIGSKQIDRCIKQGVIEPSTSDEIVTLAGSRSRDIMDLITYNNQSSQKVFTSEFKELVLFTYGNANDWNKFWKKWNTYYGLLNWEETTKQSVSKWVRLVVYLAARNHKSSMIYFLNNYWEKSSSITRSVVHDLIENDNQFNIDSERIAFKIAMNQILKVVNDGEKFDTYKNVSAVVESL